ncbi:hypothetical protein DPMN_158848 [Dreissena polymorpha]|uniref:Uncharacterized protein n=1 Tax=Dreissena polymorpha TaxID=45954 RepID=A0A9D4IR86_DREPO|nr:hypothetical protein DPMN_158848 [Dreissena polymorpha]
MYLLKKLMELLVHNMHLVLTEFVVRFCSGIFLKNFGLVEVGSYRGSCCLCVQDCGTLVTRFRLSLLQYWHLPTWSP